MVEYKVVRITDSGSSIAVVVQIPSMGGKTVPITFNPSSFNQMSDEEIEYSIQEMVDNMFSRPQTVGVGVSKIDRLRKSFGVDLAIKPTFESSRMKHNIDEVPK